MYEVFIVLDDDMLKKKLIGFASECCKGFKTQLTSKYTTKPKRNLEPSYFMYSYIDKDVWDELIKSRMTRELLAKSQKGKGNRQRNLYP